MRHLHTVFIVSSSLTVSTSNNIPIVKWIITLLYESSSPGSSPGGGTKQSLGSLIVEHRSYKAKTAEHYRNEVPNFGIDGWMSPK